MLIFVEGANCSCLHFCFLVLNLVLVQVPCTWTEFKVVARQCDEVWSRKVNQDSSDLKVIVFSLILLNRSFVIQLRLQTQNDELKSTLPLLFCKYQTLGVAIRSSEDYNSLRYKPGV